MPRFATAFATAALLASLGSAVAQAHDVIDHSNSVSATGSPFAARVPQSVNGPGASPEDDSSSVSAVGSPFAAAVPVTPRTAAGVMDWGNSASAVGGIPARRAAAPRTLG